MVCFGIASAPASACFGTGHYNSDLRVAWLYLAATHRLRNWYWPGSQFGWDTARLDSSVDANIAQAALPCVSCIRDVDHLREVVTGLRRLRKHGEITSTARHSMKALVLDSYTSLTIFEGSTRRTTVSESGSITRPHRAQK
jgi:hypothetical protein